MTCIGRNYSYISFKLELDGSEIELDFEFESAFLFTFPNEYLDFIPSRVIEEIKFMTSSARANVIR